MSTSFSNARHDVSSYIDVKSSTREVVEEGERRGAVTQDVVDTHRHQVDADAAVLVDLLGNLQFCAHAVRC